MKYVWISGLVGMLGTIGCESGGAAGGITFEAAGRSYEMVAEARSDIHAGARDCDTSTPGDDWTCVYRHWNADGGAGICFPGTGVGTYGGEISLLFDNHQHTSAYAVPENVVIGIEQYGDRLVGSFEGVVKQNRCSEDERSLGGDCPYEQCVSIVNGRFDVPYIGHDDRLNCRAVVGPGVGANGPTCP